MTRFTAKLNNLTLAVCLLAGFSAAGFAQETPTPKLNPAVLPTPPVVRPVKPAVRIYKAFDEKITSEKSLAVDAKVSVSLCVLKGNLKINGWDRNEIRLFVQNGSRGDFKISQKNQDGNPVWVRILRGTSANYPQPNECLSGDEIEIDLPRTASLIIKGQETETSIDSIRKASLKNIGGNIFLNNIAEGIEAQTYQGDITAENCSGTVNLESDTGNITVFEAAPSEIGDVFKAKTSNGAIVLQNVSHRQIEANSISGTISYDGNLPSGGLYTFSTSNGSILMTLPGDSSCKINASYGFGEFVSELPLKDTKQNNVSKVQNLTALLGAGDATLNLTTNSGKIRIKDKK